MKIVISLSVKQKEVLDTLMGEDLADNRSAFVGFLIGQEYKRRQEDRGKRGPGRPKGNSDITITTTDELPPEDAPRTLSVPKDLLPFVLPYEKKKKVNEFEILMLQAKKDDYDAKNA